MSTVNHIESCPGCSSKEVETVFTGKDFSVSGESFEVLACKVCLLRFTGKVPDLANIGKYYSSENYISHTNTSEGLVNRLYHFVRRFTLRTKKKVVESESGQSSGKLLDIGAGTGAFASFMATNGWMVTGLEPDEKARGIAYKMNKISLLPIENLYKLPKESFDVITLWHVLEHVHDIHGYLSTLKELLKPGGLLLVAVPNFTSKDAGYYKKEWAAYDLPRHLYHFSPQAMRKILAKHSLNLIKLLPMWFDSYYVSMLSEKYRGNSGIRGIIKGFYMGALSNLAAVLKKESCSSVIYVVRK